MTVPSGWLLPNASNRNSYGKSEELEEFAFHAEHRAQDCIGDSVFEYGEVGTRSLAKQLVGKQPTHQAKCQNRQEQQGVEVCGVVYAVR